ncbi:MAG TPA: glycosyltransferase family 39 protein [Candidatus Angelobacter sp.]|nr:glycosyltransferase family 39 protein [Candidatus Angelobacter sp.]
MERRAGRNGTGVERDRPHGAGPGWIVVAAACFVFLISIASPPRLMDDVDAVQAQIARNMLVSGDWVTARLDGVAYLEKAPLVYWTMAVSYKFFGVHDWAARLPLALAVVLLCFVTYRFGRWAFGERAGMFGGIVLATSAGLFLFTRILIPDAMLTLTITGAIWAWLRLLEPDEERAQSWAVMMGVCFGAGLLLKGLIAVVFPVLAGLVFMAVTRQLFSRAAWKKLDLWLVAAIAVLIAAPWHILAAVNNPPTFAFSLHSGPGEYRGFFWFYFFNEHLLRFLNMRYPRDYNTVPRLWFWLLNLVWLFPWSAYLPAAMKQSYREPSRASRTRLMAVCWIGVVMVFFTFSTTQEYYSMPVYPALALLLGSALASGSTRLRVGTWILQIVSALVFAALAFILLMVWKLPATGDISQALTQHPELYTLSMGHMGDLTLNAFAYLKLPLALAAIAFAAITLGLARWRNDIRRVVMVVAAGMVIFFQAARLALVRFDGYLGSYPLAQSLMKSPPGQLVEANAYYAFSSVFFYTGRTALLLNGRMNNLEYGSYAPGAPSVFIDDAKFNTLWRSHSRYYLLAYGSEKARLEQLVGPANLHVVAENAGNYLFTNLAVPSGKNE